MDDNAMAIHVPSNQAHQIVMSLSVAAKPLTGVG